ncbi:MAG: MFS transporter [Cryobacterium sp.]|nr:MFS transporter [Cryobacterium sp.]
MNPSLGTSRSPAFAICVIIAALTLLDLSKINVTLTAIERGLEASPADLQLIVVGYALSFGLALIPAGRFGDVRSRRSTLIVGLVLFVVTSLACSLAMESWQLVLGRLAQGVVAGILMPQVLGIIQQLYTGTARARAFGIIGVITGLCVALGPTLGGVLITVGGEDWGWRFIWLMNVPLGLAVLPFAILSLPRDESGPGRRRELDLVGTSILGLAIAAFITPFVLTTGRGHDVPARWALLAVAAVLFWVFVRWERSYVARGKSPVVDVELMRVPSFRLGTTLTTLYFGALASAFLLMNIFVQEGLGISPLFAGLLTLPYAATYIASASLSPRLSVRMGLGYQVLGFSIMIVAISLTAVVGFAFPPETAGWAIAVSWGITGLGVGGLSAQNQTFSLSEIPAAHAGVAGSINQLGQRVGTAIGIAATSTIYLALAPPGTSLTLARPAFLYAMMACVVLAVIALWMSAVSLRRRGRGWPLAPTTPRP